MSPLCLGIFLCLLGCKSHLYVKYTEIYFLSSLSFLQSPGPGGQSLLFTAAWRPHKFLRLDVPKTELLNWVPSLPPSLNLSHHSKMNHHLTQFPLEKSCLSFFPSYINPSAHPIHCWSSRLVSGSFYTVVLSNFEACARAFTADQSTVRHHQH